MTEQVIISPEPLDLDADLTQKLAELRSKRDAVSLNHEDIKRDNDTFNKTIICLSLFTGFFETLKGQLNLNNSPNDIIRNGSAIAPIFLSTLVGIISSLLKFKKYPEKMEELTKASEKCNFSITRIRELKQTLNFEDHGVIKNSYISEVLDCYRDSLQIIEQTLYPDQRQAYYLKAQENLLKIGKDDNDFKNNLKNIEGKLEKINFKPISRKEEIKRTKTPHPLNKKDLIDLPFNYTEPLEHDNHNNDPITEVELSDEIKKNRQDITYKEFKENIV